jgi:sulfatase maturation enzyme AslB (radical SAM superfamily)
MVNPPKFQSLRDMESSSWLANIKELMQVGQWPEECVRCQQTESINGTSIRLYSIAFDSKQTQADYLTVGGVLDNICNSACMTCNENLSTKIGSLISKQYKIVDNTNQFWNLPQERIVHLDLNGGEPSASKNYKSVLANLPKNVRSIRLNTNGSTVLTELTDLVACGIEVTVTVSLDGIGATHDYIRWPIKWDKFYANLMRYKEMNVNLNTWTTVSALNIQNLPAIQEFCKEHELQHSYALLNNPIPLNVKYQNHLTTPAQDIIPGQVAIDENNQVELDAFLLAQEKLRNV